MIVSFGWIAYVVIMHARYGQTLGKMVMGVKVLDLSDGSVVVRLEKQAVEKPAPTH